MPITMVVMISASIRIRRVAMKPAAAPMISNQITAITASYRLRQWVGTRINAPIEDRIASTPGVPMLRPNMIRTK